MKVRIFEVGPRDGLQNEKQSVSLEDRKIFVNLLRDAGHRDIEIGAFVNPQKVPQMAMSKELALHFKNNSFRAWVLVPNNRGYQDFSETGLKHLAVFTAASETFNQKNINASIQESFDRFNAFVPDAKKKKVKVRGYVSTCFGCPYEGAVKPKKVLEVTEKLLKAKADEISIGDTIGVATPNQVKELVKPLLKLVGRKKLALHFHDTRGTALANILKALEMGVEIFDSSSGGLGGCPYAPGAAGNVATEDLLYLFRGLKIRTGIDLQAQLKASLFIQEKLGRVLPSKVLQAEGPKYSFDYQPQSPVLHNIRYRIRRFLHEQILDGLCPHGCCLFFSGCEEKNSQEEKEQEYGNLLHHQRIQKNDHQTKSQSHRGHEGFL